MVEVYCRCPSLDAPSALLVIQWSSGSTVCFSVPSKVWFSYFRLLGFNMQIDTGQAKCYQFQGLVQVSSDGPESLGVLSQLHSKAFQSINPYDQSFHSLATLSSCHCACVCVSWDGFLVSWLAGVVVLSLVPLWYGFQLVGCFWGGFVLNLGSTPMVKSACLSSSDRPIH